MNACVLRMVAARDDTDALLEARRLSRGNRALPGDNRMVTAGDDTYARLETRRLSKGNRALPGETGLSPGKPGSPRGNRAR